MRRLVAWLVGLAALGGWQVYAVHRWGAEHVMGPVYVVAAVASVAFMALYARDPWWRSWFGRSLMLLAAAVFLAGLSVVLHRDVLMLAAVDATLVAMVLRTAVLVAAQRRDEHRNGHHVEKGPSDE